MRRRGTLQDDPHRRAVVRLDDGSDVAYRDVRRFGTWLLLEPSEARPVPRREGRRRAARGGLHGRSTWSAGSSGAARREGGAARPAHARRAREHLRRRGALARSDPSAASRGESRPQRDPPAPSSDPGRARARDRAAGIDAPRLRACPTAAAARCRTSSRSTVVTASRATGAERRSRGRESPGAARGSARPVSPSGPRRRRSGRELVERALAVEAPELRVAADRSSVDQDLRHRPAAGEVEHGLPERLVVVEMHLLVGDAATSRSVFARTQ